MGLAVGRVRMPLSFAEATDVKPALLILAVCGLLLSACYSSSGLLLDADAAVHPLPDGVYARIGGSDDRWKVSLQADGWYLVEHYNDNGTLGESRRALFNAVDPIAGHPTFAVAMEADEGFEYVTLVTDQSRVFLATPDCGDPVDRNLAVDHGGSAGDDGAMTHNCTFHDRGALLSALAAQAGQADFGRPYQRR